MYLSKSNSNNAVVVVDVVESTEENQKSHAEQGAYNIFSLLLSQTRWLDRHRFIFFYLALSLLFQNAYAVRGFGFTFSFSCAIFVFENGVRFFSVSVPLWKRN